MSKPFTKAMVKAIEERFNIQMTEEQIAQGSIELEHKVWASDIVIKVCRSYTGSTVFVTARFKHDKNCYLRGEVENSKLKAILKKI